MLPVLEGLSAVKRFDMVSMFLSTKEKKGKDKNVNSCFLHVIVGILLIVFPDSLFIDCPFNVVVPPHILGNHFCVLFFHYASIT